MITGDNCPKEKTDEELVGLALKNQDFYLCLMLRYEEKLKRYIKRISSATSHDAEDILQEIFIKVYQNLNEFDQKLKFSSWIYRITYNQVVSNFRRQKARPILSNSQDNQLLLDSLMADLDLQREVDWKERSHEVKQVLKSLDKKYQEVLVLKFLEDKNYREISDVLKKPVGTVATLINRAKKQFREKCQKQNIEF